MFQHFGFRKSRSIDSDQTPPLPPATTNTNTATATATASPKDAVDVADSVHAMITDDEDAVDHEEEKKEVDGLDQLLASQASHDSTVSINNLGDQIEVEEFHDEKKPRTPLTPQRRRRVATQSSPRHHHHRASAPHDDDAATTSTGSVSFGPVRVREYERVIDSTNIYMGLALGWSYNDVDPAPVRERNQTSKYSVGGASHGGDESRMKRTNGSDRYGMMLRYGYAQKELKEATKEAAKFYKQRQREAARSLVVAENKKTDPQKPKRRPLLRSMFG